MKKVYFYLLLGGILLISSSLLFWQEKQQRKEAGEKYTVAAFSHTENVFDIKKRNNEKVFDFFIENTFQETQNYKTAFFVNQEKIGEREIEISSGSEKTVSLSPETVKKITQFSESSLEYKVEISYENKKSAISKKIDLIK